MHARTVIDESIDCVAYGEEKGTAGLPALFDILAAQDWSVLVLERHLPDLLQWASTLSPEDRCAWLSGLHGIWHRRGWALTRSGKQALLQLASSWCAWTLAHAIGTAMHDESPLDDDDALRMIDACRHLGDGNTAIDLAVRLQLLHPEEQRYLDVHAELAEWMRWRDAMPTADGTERGDDDIRLEPLAHHHLPDFAWQYYDPAIAELCCLPSFQDDPHWHRWLGEVYADGDQRIFAVLHREWGFIGCVSLIMHSSVGFVYYWLGPDFQKQGLGPRAVSLLLAMAQRDYGMRCCYAKVFDYNEPSRRTLEKLGFESLGICGVAPDNDQMFYRCGEDLSAELVAHELHMLLALMDSDTKAAVPLF